MERNNLSFDFEEANIKRLKDLLSQEIKDDAENPLKICMKLIFSSSIEKDPEKRAKLSEEFCDFLLRPGGVMYLFLAMIDFDKTSQKSTTHNQRFMAIANIIAYPPKLTISYDKYFDNIYQQIFSLLTSDNLDYTNLGCIVLRTMMDCPRAKDKDMDSIVTNPLRDALRTRNSILKPHESIVAINNMILNNIPVRLFVDLSRSLYYALVVLYKSPSRLKTILKTSLTGILNNLPTGAACCLIEDIVTSTNPHPVYDISDQDDEITIQILENEEKSIQDQLDLELGRLVVANLVEECGNEILKLEFFFHFRDRMWSCLDERLSQTSASLIELLMDRIDILEIMTDHKGKSLELIYRSLTGYLNFLREGTDDAVKMQVAVDSMTSCIDILQVISTTVEKSDYGVIINKCLPLLSEMKDIAEMISLDAILYQKLKSLIESLKCLDDTQTPHSKDRQEFELIVKELNDKLVPVRVHALVRLKEHIIANQAYTISQIPRIVSLIEASLADPEPYVFLSCINLMAEMAVRKTDDILPRLLELHHRQDLDIQHRINIGEVLVRLSRQLNRTTPHYAKDFIHALLRGVRDSEELIRISSLTNIGQICKNLGASLGKYFVEILTCVEDVIDTDNVQVKCAALDLLRSTLSGLDRETLFSIQSDLSRTYKVLKKAKSKTLDDTFCLQADLALDEIDELARMIMGLDVHRANY